MNLLTPAAVIEPAVTEVAWCFKQRTRSNRSSQVNQSGAPQSAFLDVRAIRRHNSGANSALGNGEIGQAAGFAFLLEERVYVMSWLLVDGQNTGA
jgi:hypothetical protein